MKVFLSLFGSGYLPKIPGTWGTLFSMPIIFLVLTYLHWGTALIFLCLLTLISFIVINKFYLVYPNTPKDAKWIVIDEFLGIYLTALFIIGSEVTLLSLFIIFITFRVFDIIKIWPANYFDNKSYPEAIILDDLVSAVYAGSLSYGLLYMINNSI